MPKTSLSSWPRADDATSADATTIAKSVGESRLPGIAKNSTTTEVSSGEAGPSWRRACDMDNAVVTAAVKSAGEARLLTVRSAFRSLWAVTAKQRFVVRGNRSRKAVWWVFVL